VIQWVAVILIFYPRKGFVGTSAGGSTLNTTVGTASASTHYALTNKGETVAGAPGSGAGVPLSSDTYATAHNPEKAFAYNSPGQLAGHPPQTPVSPTSSSRTPMSTVSSSVPSTPTMVPLLKRNISISRDGRMVYGDTKPLGKVGGSEFVAVEKADPNVIPSYYFVNELGDSNGGSYPEPVPPLPTNIPMAGYKRQISRSTHDTAAPQQSQQEKAPSASSAEISSYDETPEGQEQPQLLSQQARMLQLQRQQGEYAALRKAAKELRDDDDVES